MAAARYTNGVGTAPRNSKCTFPFTANGRRYDDCVTEDLGELNLANTRHPQSQAHVRHPVGEGTGAHIGWGWCSVDHEYVGRWGECYAPGYTPTALNGGDTSATLRPDPHAQYWSPHSCIVEVLPRCAGHQGGDVITIIGRNFVSGTDLSVKLSIASGDAPTNVTYVSHKELQAVMPAFPDISETTKGRLHVQSGGVAIRFCSDAATNDANMHLAQVTIQGPSLAFYVADSVNHRVHLVNYKTGLTVNERSSEWRSGGLQNPAGLDVGPDGALYVASSGTNQVLRYDTSNFDSLGKFADVPGQPRGIRFRGNDLFVVSYYERRILRYKHGFSSEHQSQVHNTRSDERGRQATFAGYFTQDMSNLFLSDRREVVDHPSDLVFHAVDGELKLLVSSAQAGSVLQFNGLTGAYEKVFNDVPINMVSSMALAHRGYNRDLFLTSPFAGTTFVRFDGTNGKMKHAHRDPTVRRAKGLMILGDTIMVSDREAVRAFDIDSGAILQDAVTIQGARLGAMTPDMLCHADQPQTKA